MLLEEDVAVEVVEVEVLEGVGVDEVHVHSALIVVFLAISKKNAGIWWENLPTMLTLHLPTHRAALVGQHQRSHFSLFLRMSTPSSYSTRQHSRLLLP